MDFETIYQYSKDLTVLYAEDDSNIQEETLDILEMFFPRVDTVSNGKEAYDLYCKNHEEYDLVITDISMPVMDGTELIKNIHKINSEQVIIVISAYNESSRLIDLIELGIYSFIMKPVNQEQFFTALYKSSKIVYNQKELLKYTHNLEHTNNKLVEELSQKNKELTLTQQVGIEAIATMVESYDDETGAHVKRIRAYMDVLIKNAPDSLGSVDISKEMVSFSAILHDIGKLMIPKDILTKPQKLSEDEFEIIKKHAALGGEVLYSANELFKKQFHKDSFLKIAAEIAVGHHEKWDGSGYPYGKKEHEIPFCARLTALCDVYDALRSKRVYKPSMSHQKALQIIQSESGKAFDPEVVELFLQNHEAFDKIFEELH